MTRGVSVSPTTVFVLDSETAFCIISHMQSTSLWLLLLGLGMFLLAACGGGEVDPAPTVTPAVRSQPTPAATPSLSSKSTIASELEVCPPSPANHADLMNFDWQSRPMQSGEAANVVYSPSDPEVLYLGIEANTQSIYRSSDGGRSWSLLHFYGHAKDVTVHPENPDIVFYTDSQGIWRTTTGGSVGNLNTSFQRVMMHSLPAGPPQTSISSVVIAPSNPNVVYASIKGSADPNDRFEQGQLYRSTNGGDTFLKVDGQIAVFNVLLVDPNRDDRVIVGGHDGIYISNDGGQSFSQTTPSRDVAGLDSVDGEIILAATGEGILRSSDGGNSWELHTEGLPSTITLRVSLARSSPNVVWATTTDGVAKSIDGGFTWTHVSGTVAASGLPSRNLQALSVHPENPDIALVATDTYIFSVRSSSLFRSGQYYAQGVYRTEDGGQTWSRSDAGIFEYNLEDVTAHPTRPFEVWAGQQASRGFYRSRDAGQSWSLSPSLLTHYPMRFVFFPDNPDKAASTSAHAEQDFGITYDSGINWETTSEQTFFDSVGPGISLFDPSKRFGSNLHLHGLAIDPVDPQVIYVGSNDDPDQFNPKPLRGAHLFKSTDGGKTWTESDNGFSHDSATAIHEIKIDPQDTNTIYIGTTEHGARTGNGLWKSIDTGSTWTRANNGMEDDSSVYVILIQPKQSNVLLAGTGEGIYSSTDGGASWNQVATGTTRDMEYDLSDPDVVYAGKEDGVFLSKDFGLTWQDISAKLPAGEISALAVNCNGTVVYAGVAQDRSGEGLFVSVASSVSNVPVDSTTGVEFGRPHSLPQVGQSGGPSREELQCLIEALGEDVVRELGPGGREPTSNEIERMKQCR